MMPSATPMRPSSSWHLLRWAVGILLGAVLLAGCSGFSADEEPLPDRTFTRVLTDLHVASMRTSADTAAPPHLRDSIFAHHNVRAAEFEATLQYYSRRPDRFETLYQTVIDTLQALRFPSQKRSAPRERPDSIRGASQEGDNAP